MTLEGYYVIVKDSDDETSVAIKQALARSSLVNLKNTRSFNALTGGEFKHATQSASNTIRNRQEEKKAQRKAYNSKPEVKERLKEYNKLPEVRERKRKNRELRQKLLKRVPKEVVMQVLKEDEQLQAVPEKKSAE